MVDFLLLRIMMLLCTIIIMIVIVFLLPNRIPYYAISITIPFIITIIITNFKMLHFDIEYILPQLVNNLLLVLYFILQRQYIGP